MVGCSHQSQEEGTGQWHRPTACLRSGRGSFMSTRGAPAWKTSPAAPSGCQGQAAAVRALRVSSHACLLRFNSERT